jgi:hypothetical protein
MRLLKLAEQISDQKWIENPIACVGLSFLITITTVEIARLANELKYY